MIPATTYATARDVTGILLAGGQGARMGGRDKGLINVGRRAMIEHVIEALAPQVASFLISANRNLEIYARYGRVVVRDNAPHMGPLAGIVAGMHVSQTPYVALAPCDAPHYAPDHVAAMLQTLRHDIDIVIPHDGERLQPLFALLRTGLHQDLSRYLADGGRRAMVWMTAQRHLTVDCSHRAHSFANINTPADLRGG